MCLEVTAMASIELSEKLFKYASQGRVKKMKQELDEMCISPDITNTQGRTLLYASCLHGHLKTSVVLLLYGANPNRRSSDGSTPTHAAACSGSEQLLHQVVQKGGDLRLHDNMGRTPKDWAVSAGDKKSRKVLDTIKSWQKIVDRDILSNQQSCENGMDSTSSLSNLQRNQHIVISNDKLPTACQGHGVFLSLPFDGMFSRNLGLAGLLPLAFPAQFSAPDDEITVCYKSPPCFIMEGTWWCGHRVTIKRLKNHSYHGPLHEAEDLLISEINVNSHLRHPNLLMLMAVCLTSSSAPYTCSPQHWLVYEPVSVGSLYRLLHRRNTSVSLKDTAKVMVQVADALMYIHERGFIHCAINSHAIHITETLHAKLGDLSFLCRARQGASPSNSIPTAFNRWLAPEVLSKLPVSFATDVYGFCLTTLESITGNIPWAGYDCESIPEVVASQCERIMLPEAIPGHIESLLSNGLRYQGSRRLVKIKALSHALRNLLNASEKEEELSDVSEKRKTLFIRRGGQVSSSELAVVSDSSLDSDYLLGAQDGEAHTEGFDVPDSRPVCEPTNSQNPVSEVPQLQIDDQSRWRCSENTEGCFDEVVQNPAEQRCVIFRPIKSMSEIGNIAENQGMPEQVRRDRRLSAPGKYDARTSDDGASTPCEILRNRPPRSDREVHVRRIPTYRAADQTPFRFYSSSARDNSGKMLAFGPNEVAPSHDQEPLDHTRIEQDTASSSCTRPKSCSAIVGASSSVGLPLRELCISDNSVDNIHGKQMLCAPAIHQSGMYQNNLRTFPKNVADGNVNIIDCGDALNEESNSPQLSKEVFQCKGPPSSTYVPESRRKQSRNENKAANFDQVVISHRTDSTSPAEVKNIKCGVDEGDQPPSAATEYWLPDNRGLLGGVEQDSVDDFGTKYQCMESEGYRYQQSSFPMKRAIFSGDTVELDALRGDDCRKELSGNVSTVDGPTLPVNITPRQSARSPKMLHLLEVPSVHDSQTEAAEDGSRQRRFSIGSQDLEEIFADFATRDMVLPPSEQRLYQDIQKSTSPADAVPIIPEAYDVPDCGNRLAFRLPWAFSELDADTKVPTMDVSSQCNRRPWKTYTSVGVMVPEPVCSRDANGADLQACRDHAVRSSASQGTIFMQKTSDMRNTAYKSHSSFDVCAPARLKTKAVKSTQTDAKYPETSLQWEEGMSIGTSDFASCNEELGAPKSPGSIDSSDVPDSTEICPDQYVSALSSNEYGDVMKSTLASKPDQNPSKPSHSSSDNDRIIGNCTDIANRFVRVSSSVVPPITRTRENSSQLNFSPLIPKRGANILHGEHDEPDSTPSKWPFTRKRLMFETPMVVMGAAGNQTLENQQAKTCDTLKRNDLIVTKTQDIAGAPLSQSYAAVKELPVDQNVNFGRGCKTEETMAGAVHDVSGVTTINRDQREARVPDSVAATPSGWSFLKKMSYFKNEVTDSENVRHQVAEDMESFGPDNPLDTDTPRTCEDRSTDSKSFMNYPSKTDIKTSTPVAVNHIREGRVMCKDVTGLRSFADIRKNIESSSSPILRRRNLLGKTNSAAALAGVGRISSELRCREGNCQIHVRKPLETKTEAPFGPEVDASTSTTPFNFTAEHDPIICDVSHLLEDVVTQALDGLADEIDGASTDRSAFGRHHVMLDEEFQVNATIADEGNSMESQKTGSSTSEQGAEAVGFRDRDVLDRPSPRSQVESVATGVCGGFIKGDKLGLCPAVCEDSVQNATSFMSGRFEEEGGQDFSSLVIMDEERSAACGPVSHDTSVWNMTSDLNGHM